MLPCLAILAGLGADWSQGQGLGHPPGCHPGGCRLLQLHRLLDGPDGSQRVDGGPDVPAPRSPTPAQSPAGRDRQRAAPRGEGPPGRPGGRLPPRSLGPLQHRLQSRDDRAPGRRPHARGVPRRAPAAEDHPHLRRLERDPAPSGPGGIRFHRLRDAGAVRRLDQGRGARASPGRGARAATLRGAVMSRRRDPSPDSGRG